MNLFGNGSEASKVAQFHNQIALYLWTTFEFSLSECWGSWNGYADTSNGALGSQRCRKRRESAYFKFFWKNSVSLANGIESVRS